MNRHTNKKKSEQYVFNPGKYLFSYQKFNMKEVCEKSAFEMPLFSIIW